MIEDPHLSLCMALVITYVTMFELWLLFGFPHEILVMPSIRKKSLACASYGIKGSNYIHFLFCSMLDKSSKFSLKKVVNIITLLPFEVHVLWYAKIIITLSWDVDPHPGPLNVIYRVIVQDISHFVIGM